MRDGLPVRGFAVNTLPNPTVTAQIHWLMDRFTSRRGVHAEVAGVLGRAVGALKMAKVKDTDFEPALPSSLKTTTQHARQAS